MSHDVGGGPFRPNKKRGIWARPSDFAFACLNNALRVDNIYPVVIVPMVLCYDFTYIALWIVGTLMFAIPMFFIQSFLGQFSSSGYISALRISPLFKGIGYIGLAMNLLSLTFQCILIAVPMLYFIHSLQPTLPWSCETSSPWNDNKEPVHPEMPYFNRSQCDLHPTAENESEGIVVILTITSVKFFVHRLSTFNFEIFACVLIVWGAVTYVAYQSTAKIGIYMRYCTIAAVSFLCVVFVRLLFLPGILAHIAAKKPYYMPDSWIFCLLMAAVTAFLTFGPGWGSVQSLASHNRFKADIVSFSWQVPVSQLGIFVLLGLVTNMAEVHITKAQQNVATNFIEMQWLSFMTIPSTLAALEYPHLWTWAFLLMLILGCFNSMLTQLFSVHTALLDEFERLRPFRKELLFGSAAVLALISAYFCTMNGLSVIESLVDMNLFSQCALNLVLILVVLWVYGRDRFQRDVKFMTSDQLSNWQLTFIWFVSPIFVTLMAVIATVIGMNYHFRFPEYKFACLALATLPWIALPAYFISRLRRSDGGWKLRLSRCSRPNDWFPVDPEDKQLYAGTKYNPTIFL